jgi:hypothetical protein
VNSTDNGTDFRVRTARIRQCSSKIIRHEFLFWVMTDWPHGTTIERAGTKQQSNRGVATTNVARESEGAESAGAAAATRKLGRGQCGHRGRKDDRGDNGDGKR